MGRETGREGSCSRAEATCRGQTALPRPARAERKNEKAKTKETKEKRKNEEKSIT